jgi:hypothetical protein
MGRARRKKGPWGRMAGEEGREEKEIKGTGTADRPVERATLAFLSEDEKRGGKGGGEDWR